MISIIVPVYKVREEYLKRCIESIINQTYTDLEIILVDDGSPDDSGKICDEYAAKDKRIKVIHKVNNGVSSARNIGIENAKGEWISFVDADDYLENNFCEKMLENAFASNCQCVISAYNRVYNEKIEKIIKKKNLVMGQEHFFKKLFNVQSGLGFCHMKLWNAKLIKDNNIKFNEDICVAEDALFCMQMSKYMNNIFFLNEPLYNYRFNSSSAVRKFDINYVEKYLKAMKIEKKYIENIYGKKYEKELNNYIVYHLLLIIINYCFHPENQNKGISSLKQVCNIEEFKDAIKYSNYDGLSLTRGITLFTIKHKLYIMTSIIAKIRQNQFKK